MSYEADEEILQDFLIEAGEILESLSEQLVELENDPDNADLLNAIFRGFHTVKGGAGFLALNHLVDVCHGAENIFDILRNNQRAVTSDLMDVILQALDTINDMFAAVQNRQELAPAEPALLAELNRLCQPETDSKSESVSPAIVANSVQPTEQVNTSSNDEMSEDEFERLLDELHGSSAPSQIAAPVVDTNKSAPSGKSSDTGSEKT
jgi:two-component system chemotaxis sensor kinase CheA